MSVSLTLAEVVRLPGPWLLVAAIFAGASLAAATRRIPRPVEGDETYPDRERLVARKWIRFSLLLSVAAVAVMAAVFLPGPDRLRIPKDPVFVAVAALVLGLMFRFPRTAGLLGLALGLALTVTLYVFSRAWTPYVGTTEVGRIDVYAVGDETMDFAVHAVGYPVAYVRLRGDRIVPLVRTARFDPLWPVLGWRGWYRLSGFAGLGGAAFPYEQEAGVVEWLYAVFLRYGERLPGVRLVWSESTGGQAEPGITELEAYSIMLSEGGSVSFVSRKP